MSIALMLTNWTDRFSTSTERFFLGVTMTLVGLTIVLLVLALISLMVSIISRLIRRKNDAWTATADSGSVVFAPAVNQPAADHAGDAAWIAVLAAAIQAFNASAGKQTTAGFVIRKFRRV